MQNQVREDRFQGYILTELCIGYGLDEKVPDGEPDARPMKVTKQRVGGAFDKFVLSMARRGRGFRLRGGSIWKRQ